MWVINTIADVISINYYFPQAERERMLRNNSQTALKRKPRAISTFLKKTYELLRDDQNNDVVRWSPNGIGFIVLNQQLFSRKVLPRYFKHSNYSSFVRQLNMYNFHKIRENNSESYFHHQCFDRENEDKLAQIRRKPEKKKRKNQESQDSVSENENHQQSRHTTRKIKEEVKITVNPRQQQTEKKIQSQKKTNPFFSSEYNGDEQNNDAQWRNACLDEEDDKISINNEISERILPRLATRELFYPSNNNLFPFGGVIGQTSTFCLFF